jgi:hypothetical protein
VYERSVQLRQLLTVFSVKGLACWLVVATLMIAGATSWLCSDSTVPLLWHKVTIKARRSTMNVL